MSRPEVSKEIQLSLFQNLQTANFIAAQVLRCYKVLLRTRAKVFAGDSGALQLMAAKAREEFDKNRSLTDPEEIKKVFQSACLSI